MYASNLYEELVKSVLFSDTDFRVTLADTADIAERGANFTNPWVEELDYDIVSGDNGAVTAVNFTVVLDKAAFLEAVADEYMGLSGESSVPTQVNEDYVEAFDAVNQLMREELSVFEFEVKRIVEDVACALFTHRFEFDFTCDDEMDLVWQTARDTVSTTVVVSPLDVELNFVASLSGV